ncbi:MAG: RNA methyltransferase [Xanthomonadales bacterium]|nr:RNA methyltransferase [Xanthomonadales bacterium]
MSQADPHVPLRIVLVGTSHPGNIGSAARAMKTMGLRRLVLVAPECDPISEDAWAMSAGAHDLISQAPRFDSLAEALADSTLVIGSTARLRHVRMPEWSPREGATRAAAEVVHGGCVDMVFGRERTGLTNEELHLCGAAVHIPSDPEFSSLNLAAAVQILAYELRLALNDDLPGGDSPSAQSHPAEPPAAHAELEGLIGHLDQTLHDIDFHKGRSPETVMQRLRRLFSRARPSDREVRILRGIFSDMQRVAGLARKAENKDGKEEAESCGA